jgi:hypothetical protein
MEGKMVTGTVTAVIALEVPLDLPDDASEADKLQATIDVLDSLNVPASASAAVRWREVNEKL